MGYYIFAPAGPVKLQSNLLQKCVEYIGATQTGHGSNLSKGKRYLKYKINCSGTAIKRTIQTRPKVIGNDYQMYGIDVYYYHTEVCVDIVQEIIQYIKIHSNDTVKKKIFTHIPNDDERYIDLLYAHRISQLYWVSDEDYKGQGKKARKLIDRFTAYFA